MGELTFCIGKEIVSKQIGRTNHLLLSSNGDLQFALDTQGQVIFGCYPIYFYHGNERVGNDMSIYFLVHFERSPILSHGQSRIRVHRLQNNLRNRK